MFTINLWHSEDTFWYKTRTSLLCLTPLVHVCIESTRRYLERRRAVFCRVVQPWRSYSLTGECDSFSRSSRQWRRVTSSAPTRGLRCSVSGRGLTMTPRSVCDRSAWTSRRTSTWPAITGRSSGIRDSASRPPATPATVWLTAARRPLRCPPPAPTKFVTFNYGLKLRKKIGPSLLAGWRSHVSHVNLRCLYL